MIRVRVKGQGITAVIFRTVMFFPQVCGSTNTVFSANIGDQHTRFTFFEYLDDLALAVSAPFHVWLLFYQLCLLIDGTILGESYLDVIETIDTIE